MSYWNYRIIRHKDPQGDWLALHEVTYDDDGNPNGCTEEPIDFSSRFNGEGEEWAYKDLVGSVRRALRHLKKYPDVLDYDQF